MAERWLLETFGGHVERVLFRVLGDSRGLEDLVQEVFVRVFAKIASVREPDALRAYITSVAVFVARETIRKKRRHRWLSFFASDEIPEVRASDDPEAREGLRAFYATLDELNLDERLVFTLRFVEGLELSDVAHACGISLATTKRRLQRAEASFLVLCKRDETLSTWLEEGDRWS